MNKAKFLPVHLQRHFPAILDMLNEIDILTPKELKQIWTSSSVTQKESPFLKAMYGICTAKIHLLEGNLVKANNLATIYFPRFTNPDRYELIEHPKAMGLMACELSIIFFHTNEMKLSSMAMDMALKLTKDKKLSLVIDAQNALIKVMSHVESDTKELLSVLNQLLRVGLKYHYVMFQLNYVRYLMSIHDTKAVKNILETIQLINKNIHYFYFSEVIKLLNVRLRLQQSNRVSSVQYLKNLSQSIDCPFHKVMSYSLLAEIYCMDKHSIDAIKILIAAETESKKYDLSELLPGIYFQIAKIMENNFSAHEWTARYLEKVNELIIEQYKEGLRISGEQFKMIEFYQNHLKDQTSYHQNFQYLSHYFAFADGRNWKELKLLFQYNALMNLSVSNPKLSSYFEDIQLNPSTFHTIKYKLRDAGYKIPKPVTPESLNENPNIIRGLQTYITFNRPFTWDTFTQQFENDMIYYLFIKNDSEKIKLSKAIGLSYPMIIAKTKFLEKNSDTFSTDQQKEFDEIIKILTL
jgi:hypothetical protein